MRINRMVASSQMPSADRRASYRAIILAHMLRKKLGAETGGASFDHLVGAHGGRGHVFLRPPGTKCFSPLPVALVEGCRRAQPGTPDTLGARKAKVFHEVNQALAQSKIRRRPVDRFDARHFDLWQDRYRSFGRSHRRRLLRLCCKRPCHSHASEQADELTAPHHSITSSARASRAVSADFWMAT